MKRITLILLLFVAVFANAQEEAEFSTIHFVRTKKFKASACHFYIGFKNQSIMKLGNGEMIDYKVFSNGKFTINFNRMCDGSSGLSTSKLMKQMEVLIEPKKEYFIFCDMNIKVSGTIMELREKEDIIEYINESENNEKRFKFEENLKFPISKESIISKNGPSQGSGFLVNNKGYVITNYHVVDGAKKITVKGIKGDFGTSLQAKVVSVDRQNDLALLKIESKLVSFETPPYSIGNSKNVQQAEEVFAMGYPKKSLMGEETKVTNGIINSTSGYKGSISEFQFSATIQPGNSGGPLLDRKGNIIGIVTSMMKRKIAEGVGYAIKSNYIKFFLDEVGDIEYNKAESKLVGKDLPEQVKLISDFIYIIETE